jgi:hypothetical protein
MLGARLEVFTKTILYGFIEDRIQCKMSLAWPLMNRNRFLFVQIQTLPPSMHHKWKEVTGFASKTTNGISEGITFEEKPLRSI